MWEGGGGGRRWEGPDLALVIHRRRRDDDRYNACNGQGAGRFGHGRRGIRWGMLSPPHLLPLPSSAAAAKQHQHEATGAAVAKTPKPPAARALPPLKQMQQQQLAVITRRCLAESAEDSPQVVSISLRNRAVCDAGLRACEHRAGHFGLRPFPAR